MVGVNTDDEHGLSTYLSRFVNDTRLYEYLRPQDALSPNNFDEMILLDKFRTQYSGLNSKQNKPNYVNYAGPGLRPNLWYSQIRTTLAKPSHPDKIVVKELKSSSKWDQQPNRMVDQLTPFLVTEIFSSLFDPAFGCETEAGEQPPTPDIVLVTGSLGTTPGIVNTIVKESINLRTKTHPELQHSFLPSHAASLGPLISTHSKNQGGDTLEAAVSVLAHSKPTADTIYPDLSLPTDLYPRRRHKGLFGQ